MIAITDDGAFELIYLDFISEKFSTVEQAKETAPEFAIAVLSKTINLVEQI